MAHSFNSVGNALRVVFRISNTKYQIEQSRPAGHAVKRANANRVQYNGRRESRVLDVSGPGRKFEPCLAAVKTVSRRRLVLSAELRFTSTSYHRNGVTVRDISRMTVETTDGHGCTQIDC